jgi:protein-L-isoaspartate(D-aspartate) O-methyltransferase
MVASQVRPSDVRDARVIEAMASVPREAFVPMPYKGVAYVDEDIEVKPGRYLLEPRVLAKILAAAEIGPKDFVLEIGPATGYSTAVLAHLADAVVALEEDQELALAASATLEKLDVTNAVIINAPHREGVARQAPFQIIFINGAVDEVPHSLLQQLDDGGRLVCVLREAGVGHARLYQNSNGHFGSRRLFDANVPLLPGFETKEPFVF